MKFKEMIAKLWLGIKKLFVPSSYSAAVPSFIAIGFGILFGIFTMFIIWMLVITGVFTVDNDPQFFYGITLLLAGGFNQGMYSIGYTLYRAAPLILAGLAVGFAFRTGLFNIGAPGQMIVGATIAVYVGIRVSMPAPWHWMFALLCGMIAGGLWGFIVGALKALLNVHEVVASIMMNYVAMYSSFMFIKGNNLLDGNTSHTLGVRATAMIPYGTSAFFGGYVMNIGIILAIIAVIVIYIVLNKTTLGYQLKAVGFNKDASKYAGMNTKRNIMISMAISGILAGMGGAILFLVSGKYIFVTKDMMTAELMSVGFDGISVALLGLSNPVGALFAGLFLAYIRQGGYYLNLANYMAEMADVITAVIIYFSALSTALYALVKAKKLKFKSRTKSRKKIADEDAGGEV